MSAKKCGVWCNYCNPSDWMNKSVYYCVGCVFITEFPPEISLITKLWCGGCIHVTEIPTLPNVTHVNCNDCINLVEICELPNLVELHCYGCIKLENLHSNSKLAELVCSGCSNLEKLPESLQFNTIQCNGCNLLSEWKIYPERIKFLSCFNCPTVKFNLKLFVQFNGTTFIGRNPIVSSNPRPRNGVASRFLESFTKIKSFYCPELPTRIAIEVSINSILYAPGGLKYLELAEKYKDNIISNSA